MTVRRRTLTCLLLALCLLPLSAAADDPSARFQQALYEEVVAGRPDRAIGLYRELLVKTGQPGLEARAQLGVGRCLQQLDRHAESLQALHRVLRDHAGQVPVVRQAMALIQAYQSEAEQAVRSAKDMAQLQGEKRQLESKLAQAERRGQTELAALRGQLADLKARLRRLEAEGAARPRAAGELLRELSAREAVRRKTAGDLAEHFLRAASQERRAGRYRQALRSLLLARQYTPGDQRIASRIAAIRALLGEGATAPLEQLSKEADRLRGQLELQMAHYQRQLERIERSGAAPLARLGRLRALLDDLPEGLLSSPPANQARGRVVALMQELAGALPEAGATLPGTGGDRLAWYALPQWAAARNPPGGGIRAIELDRQLRPLQTRPTEPPGPEEWRRGLHRALSGLVNLDDPRAETFALPTPGKLVVIARPGVHHALATVLSRIRRGQGRLYELDLRLVQYAADAAVPWARWADNPAAAGDGSYLVLDAPARDALLEGLAEGGAWQHSRVGPLRVWGSQRGELEVTGKNVFLVGYRQRRVGGRLRAEPLVRTLTEGLRLELRALAAAIGVRIELALVAQRLARPVHTVGTPLGRIQVPGRSSQRMALDVELPRDGALVLFGLTNPIELTRGRPGRLAIVVGARAFDRGDAPSSQIVRRFPLGSLASLEDAPLPDLGARRSPPGLAETLTGLLQGGDKTLVLALDGSGATASATPQALSAFKQRLAVLQRLADQRFRIVLRGWRAAPKMLQGLEKLAGRSLVPAPDGALFSASLSPEQGKRLTEALARAGAVPLPLPAGPYPVRGVERLVASRVSQTRFVHDPGGPGRSARHALAGEGLVLALRLLPDDRLDLHVLIARIKELVAVPRPGGTGFEPRRTIFSGNLAATLPPGRSALIGGLLDPAHPGDRVLLLIERGK